MDAAPADQVAAGRDIAALIRGPDPTLTGVSIPLSIDDLTHDRPSRA
jgi:hypothetical protein